MDDQNTGTNSLRESSVKLRTTINAKLCEALEADLTPREVQDLERKISTIKSLGTFE